MTEGLKSKGRGKSLECSVMSSRPRRRRHHWLGSGVETVRSLKATVEWRNSSAQAQHADLTQRKTNYETDLEEVRNESDNLESSFHRIRADLVETEHRLEELNQEYTNNLMVEALLELLISCRSLRVFIATMSDAYAVRLSSEGTSDSEGDGAVTVSEETMVRVVEGGDAVTVPEDMLASVVEGDDAVAVPEDTLVSVGRPVFGMERNRHPSEHSRHSLERSPGRSCHPLERSRERVPHRVNSVRGVPLHGCSVKSSCSKRGVRKKPATDSSSSSSDSRHGRKKAKNRGSTAETIKETDSSDVCSQEKMQALTELPARVGATRKPLAQATGSSTGGGSGNGSGGVHSTAVAGDVKTMLLPTLIRQQPLPSTGTFSGTQSPSIRTPQSAPLPKSWNT